MIYSEEKVEAEEEEDGGRERKRNGKGKGRGRRKGRFTAGTEREPKVEINQNHNGRLK